MVKKSSASNSGGLNGGNTGKNGDNGYKGVRMRKWGKWVSEIRVPKSKDKIWLGSYETADKAAKAYDAAVFCMRGGGVGELYNLNFPQNRLQLQMLLSSQLQMLLSSSNIDSSSSSAATLNRFPSHLTRSQIQIVASKYANSTKKIATVAPTISINSLIVSSALPVADAHIGFPINSLDVSSALPTNSLDMSFALPVANANSMLLCQGDKVAAPWSMEPSVVENWHLNNTNCNDCLGFNRLYVQECNAAMETHYSPVVVAAIEGQRGEGLLEDAVAPRGASGGGGVTNGSNDVFCQSSSPNDPYYCWPY
ncbi:hypothetical protein MKW92_015666 [Papaver armeniacum]|nr:hypothetical protein MKW92_015666 [Papaver armeniacum]